ncbi:hypothetical protein CLF_112512 [Clonorchis sinensis]|uniref:Uncharacterized protein n=1 Tax=Clonorchis sinensis TaxID=79923 RepID=G7YWH7_CLOSI|nr:hypothetical protein CLF_112512 [Clonorchis sinensis]
MASKPGIAEYRADLTPSARPLNGSSLRLHDDAQILSSKSGFLKLRTGLTTTYVCTDTTNKYRRDFSKDSIGPSDCKERAEGIAYFFRQDNPMGNYCNIIKNTRDKRLAHVILDVICQPKFLLDGFDDGHLRTQLVAGKDECSKLFVALSRFCYLHLTEVPKAEIYIGMSTHNQGIYTVIFPSLCSKRTLTNHNTSSQCAFSVHPHLSYLTGVYGRYPAPNIHHSFRTMSTASVANDENGCRVDSSSFNSMPSSRVPSKLYVRPHTSPSAVGSGLLRPPFTAPPTVLCTSRSTVNICPVNPNPDTTTSLKFRHCQNTLRLVLTTS